MTEIGASGAERHASLPSNRMLAALAYPIGAMSAGVACLGLMAVAHCSRDRYLDYHAKQSGMWNVCVSLLLLTLFLSTLALFAVVVMPLPLGARVSFRTFLLVVITPFLAGHILNMLLNIRAAFRAYAGQRVALPLVGRVIKWREIQGQGDTRDTGCQGTLH